MSQYKPHYYSTDNQRIIIDGPTLNFTKLARDDSGLYTCEALNSQGSATINITVVVECKFSLRIRLAFSSTLVHGPELNLFMMNFNECPFFPFLSAPTRCVR
jgi:hypothetical protein